MTVTAEVEEKLQEAVRKNLAGRRLIRCLPFVRNGAPMLQVAFMDGSKKELKLLTFESRDRLCEIFKENAWALKTLR